MSFDTPWEDNNTVEKEIKTPEEEKKLEETLKKQSENLKKVKENVAKEESNNVDWNKSNGSENPKEMSDEEINNILWLENDYSESDLQKIAYFDWMDLNNEQKALLADMYINYVWEDNWMWENDQKVYKWLKQEKWDKFFNKIQQYFDDMAVGLYEDWSSSNNTKTSTEDMGTSESDLQKIAYFDWMDLNNEQKALLADMYINYVWEDNWMWENDQKVYKWLKQEKWENFINDIFNDFAKMGI